ncbi:MAG: helix-turn-helix domain-containing protein [bacterium]
MSPALTVREVARLLRVNERTVYRMALAGRLPGFRVEGTWRFLESDIAAWVAQQKKLANAGAHERTATQSDATGGR